MEVVVGEATTVVVVGTPPVTGEVMTDEKAAAVVVEIGTVEVGGQWFM